MDVLIEPSLSLRSGDAPATLHVCISEPLLAQSVTELVPEVRQLQRRGVTMVSIRRQQILRLGPQAVKSILSDGGLEISSLGFAGDFTGTLGRSFGGAVDDTRRALDMAAGLKARAVIVVPGSIGMHTRAHAEENIRLGLNSCLDDALRLRVTMLVPLNSVFGDRGDVYRPHNMSSLDWIDSLQSGRIRGLLMLRGQSPWTHLVDCWKRCLTSGGYLRVSPRCRALVGTQHLLSHIMSRLDVARGKVRVKTRAG